MSKDEIMRVRLSKAQKERIQQAAKKRDMSMSEFVLSSAMQECARAEHRSTPDPVTRHGPLKDVKLHPLDISLAPAGKKSYEPDRK